MKGTVKINEGWEIKQIDPRRRIDSGIMGSGEKWIKAEEFPAEVHDVLYAHKMIPEEYRVGWCDEVNWVDDYDWLYRCNFRGKAGAKAYLLFKGLDTIADIYLNGELIGEHDDFYVSEKIDISGKLKEENRLVVHFHGVKGVLAEKELPAEWEGRVLKCKLIRKPIHDFDIRRQVDDLTSKNLQGSEYQGVHPSFTPVGIYRDVFLVYPDETEIESSDLRAILQDYGTGIISFVAKGKGKAEGLSIKVHAMDENGKEYVNTAECKGIGGGGFEGTVFVRIENPKLWWPRGMGSPCLYNVEVVLQKDGKPIDEIKKQIGFRKVESPSMLEFIINGKRVRLFGGSMDPLQGYTHCWQPERGRRMFDMVENANMNTLRVWGEGIPQPDCFYEEADARGILIWQDFFISNGPFPNSPEYRVKYRAEAEELVLRLRHHASLLMWCGGNECIEGAQRLNLEMIGEEVLLGDFPEIVKKLDGEKYYHPTSPWGGAWANDPREGDYHCQDGVMEHAYREYPQFNSESIRVAPPVLHSLRRFVKGDLWPADYDSRYGHEDTFPYPENWAERSSYRHRGHIKVGPYWEYYDAKTPEQLIYRFAAASGKDLRKELEQVRMGSPDGNVAQSKRSKGYFCCKLMDTWPKIYCAVIDFFQEGYIPYYVTLRSMRPLLLCFDKKESMRLWLCNDSEEDFEGEVKVGIYHFAVGKYIAEERFSVTMGQGESGIIKDIAEMRYYYPKEGVLVAELYDKAGNIISDSIDYVTEERRIKFPDATLKVEMVERGILEVSTDKFARCVEILGEREGDPFGWLFSDNYFDLVPGVPKRVKIIDGPGEGKITVRPHYSERKVTVSYKKQG